MRAFPENVPQTAHIADLERRYKALKEEIAKALTRASSDDLMVIDLKRRMLHLRDELDDAVERAHLHSLSSRVLFAR